MEKKYWIGRQRSAMVMARAAVTSEARLIHYELAGRYSIKAAQCLPFMFSGSQAMTGGGRSVSHLPNPALLRPTEVSLSHLEPAARQEPDRSLEEGR